MIKFVFRWAFRLVLLAIVLVIGAILLKDTIARSFIERELRKSTGFDVKVGKVQMGLLEPRFTIDNLVVYNPSAFGGSPFFEAPDIHIEYAPGQLALGKVHLRFLRLIVRELNIVESNGRTNLIEFIHKVSPDLASNRPANEKHGSFVGIDLLNLSVGKVRYTDLARPKRTQEINLALENHLVRNVRSEEDFANIFLKLLFRAGVTIYVDEKPRPKNAR